MSGQTYTFQIWPPRLPTPNTFLRVPVPREGFIDARRNDGCVPIITEVLNARS